MSKEDFKKIGPFILNLSECQREKLKEMLEVGIHFNVQVNDDYKGKPGVYSVFPNISHVFEMIF